MMTGTQRIGWDRWPKISVLGLRLGRRVAKGSDPRGRPMDREKDRRDPRRKGRLFDQHHHPSVQGPMTWQSRDRIVGGERLPTLSLSRSRESAITETRQFSMMDRNDTNVTGRRNSRPALTLLRDVPPTARISNAFELENGCEFRTGRGLVGGRGDGGPRRWPRWRWRSWRWWPQWRQSRGWQPWRRWPCGRQSCGQPYRRQGRRQPCGQRKPAGGQATRLLSAPRIRLSTRPIPQRAVVRPAVPKTRRQPPGH